jgi:RHS repeat-associated protein
MTTALREIAGTLTTVGRGAVVIGATMLSLAGCAALAGVAEADTHITTSITTNTTWTASGSPYLLDASVGVDAGVTLTIQPGVIVEFNGSPYREFGVAGTLKAVGTSSSPITFTSSQGAAGEGAPGQYLGIIVLGTSASAQLSYTHVYYGGLGSGGYYAYGVLTTQEGASLEVDHSVFEHNQYSGVHLAGLGPATISYSTFAYNGDGLSLIFSEAVPLVLLHSKVRNNLDKGLDITNLETSKTAGAYLENNEITQNGSVGIGISMSCATARVSWPHGNRNDIYDNGPSSEFPADGSEIDASNCEALPVDWSGNYWGEVKFIEGPEPLENKSFVCGTIPADWVQAASWQSSGYLAYSKTEKPGEPSPGPIRTSDQVIPIPAPCGEGTIRYHNLYNAFYLAPGEIATEYIRIATGSPGPPSYPEPGVSDSTGTNPGAPGLGIHTRGQTVNSASGNETTLQSDLAIGGRGLELNVTRSYNAQASAAAQEEGKGVGLWGWGWTGPYGAHLVFGSTEAGQETVTVDQQNGSAIVFYKKEGGGGYEQGGWVQARLAKEGSNYIYTLPEQIKLEFNGEGKLLKETDRAGNATTVTYNGSKQIEKVTDPSGRTLTFKYNGEGLVESIKDPLGHLVSYTYVAKGGLSTVTVEGKVRWEFEYTATSPYLLKGTTDGRKHTTTREYDSSHRVIKEVVAGHERKWSYGMKETTITEPNGAVTVGTFNTADEPTKIVEAKGTGLERVTEYEYSGTTYAPTKLTDPTKHVTEYGYDEEGNRTSERDPNSDERKWEYDKQHNLVNKTSPGGEVTKVKLTAAGLPEVVERLVGAETQKTELKYDAYGEPTEVTDPLGNKTKYTYSAHGDKETEKDAEGNEHKWKYDEDSQGTEETSPRGYTTKTERNNYGLPTKITDPLGHATEIKYDANQNIESVTDGNKHTTKYEYNTENLPIKITKPNGDITETGYDSEGKKTSYIDGNKHSWEYKRNILEQITEERNPLGKIWKKTYNKAGNLETLEDPEKHTTTYSDDESSRLTKIKYSTGKPSEVTYSYNKDSKVTKMKDETGTTEDTWDKLDRLTEHKNGAGKTIKYEYNLANLPVKITYPNGKAIAREYDKDNRLSKVTDFLGHSTTFKYNADSDPTLTTFPAESENKDEYGYNEADQMTEIKMLWATTPYATFAYERDGDGQVTKITEKPLEGSVATINSVLDENDRLIEYNKHLYTYDKGNNPTEIEGKAGYTYNEADQLKESPTAKYKYNEDGQRTKLEPKSGEPATTYAYDQADHLTSTERKKGPKQTGVKEATTFDASGLTQGITINSKKYKAVWDTAEPLPILLADYGESEEEEVNYIYGPGNIPIEESFGLNAHYLHHDQQGSTRALTYWQEGNPVSWTSYGPYGNIIEIDPTKSLLGYDGQPTDYESGLAWFGVRRYDPNTGQFISSDPGLYFSGEPYAYTADNPENGTNASGPCDTSSGNFSSEASGESAGMDVQSADLAPVGCQDPIVRW